MRRAGLINELQTVGTESPDGHEGIAGAKITAVQHQTGDLQSGRDTGDIGQQLGERHPPRMRLRQHAVREHAVRLQAHGAPPMLTGAGRP